MFTKQNNATVVGFENRPDCLFIIRIRPDWDSENVPWHPGQFLRIGILDEQHSEKSLRAMTIISIEEGVFDFLIVAVEDGVTSPRLATLQVGERCYVEEFITGNFHSANLPELGGKDLWMMGTGTGIAPYLSMLQNSHKLLRQCKNIILVHSVREQQHLCSIEFISDTLLRYPSLIYVPIVTRGNGDRVRLRQRIQVVLANNSLVDDVGIPFSTNHSVVLLCGQPEMIKQSVEFLKEKGLRKHRRRTP